MGSRARGGAVHRADGELEFISGFWSLSRAFENRDVGDDPKTRSGSCVTSSARRCWRSSAGRVPGSRRSWRRSPPTWRSGACRTASWDDQAPQAYAGKHDHNHFPNRPINDHSKSISASSSAADQGRAEPVLSSSRSSGMPSSSVSASSGSIRPARTASSWAANAIPASRARPVTFAHNSNAITAVSGP